MSEKFDVDFLEGYRLSNNFLLLDFMFDAGSAYGASFGDLSTIMEPMRLAEAHSLAETVMEPLVAHFGPCTIAAGFAPLSGDSPHTFTHGKGAAIDAVFHDWVQPTEDNPEGRAPSLMLDEIKKLDIRFSRLIAYAGTEFMCIAASSRGATFKVYENTRSPAPFYPVNGAAGMTKPTFLTHSRHGGDWAKFTGLHHDRAGWRRIEGEPVFHTRRSLRPQHIRTGKYFTLIDFIRNPVAMVNGIRNVPPVKPGKQSKVARMFSEVLDPVVAAVGRLSIIRGLEGMSTSNASVIYHYEVDANLHRWVSNVHRVEFMAPFIHDGDAVIAALRLHPGVLSVAMRYCAWGQPIYEVCIKSFEPARYWTSALSPFATCPCC